MDHIKTRYDIARLLPKDGGYAVEVGVANGDWSFDLLSKWAGICYMVDLWLPLDPKAGQEVIPIDENERRYARVLKRAGEMRLKLRARPMRVESTEAARMFADGEMDLVYLDGDHSTEGITKDIAAWWSKVRDGGYIGGHDFLQGNHGGVDYGVRDVVEQFVKDQGLKLHVIEDGEWPSWLAWREGVSW